MRCAYATSKPIALSKYSSERCSESMIRRRKGRSTHSVQSSVRESIAPDLHLRGQTYFCTVGRMKKSRCVLFACFCRQVLSWHSKTGLSRKLSLQPFWPEWRVRSFSSVATDRRRITHSGARARGLSAHLDAVVLHRWFGLGQTVRSARIASRASLGHCCCFSGYKSR